MTDSERVAMWDAINEYARSCGGDTSKTTVSNRRMDAVAAVERVIAELELAVGIAAGAHLEAGFRGAHGIYPDWVYEARNAVRHQKENIPWLSDLLRILGWQGGTVHQALNAVSRLVEADKAKGA